MPKNKKKKNETKIPDVKFINAKDAHPGMYGKHGDNCFFNLDENTTHAHACNALRVSTWYMCALRVLLDLIRVMQTFSQLPGKIVTL